MDRRRAHDTKQDGGQDEAARLGRIDLYEIQAPASPARPPAGGAGAPSSAVGRQQCLDVAQAKIRELKRCLPMDVSVLSSQKPAPTPRRKSG
jgi:hypothetical protein